MRGRSFFANKLAGGRASSNSGVVAVPPAASAFDPTFNPIYFIVSAANRVAKRSLFDPNTVWAVSIGTLGHLTGNFYFEVVFQNDGSGTAYIGLGNASTPQDVNIGGTANLWLYSQAGDGLHAGAFSGAYASYAVTDTIGIGIRMASTTVEFFKNGVSQGDAFANLSGTMFPVVSHAVPNNQFLICTSLAQMSFFPGGVYSAWG